MWKSKIFPNFEWCGGWNNGVMGSWTTWFLDFNKRGAWNKRGDAKCRSFLINVVAEITELWVENSQKINCRGVTPIREGRVSIGHYQTVHPPPLTSTYPHLAKIFSQPPPLTQNNVPYTPTHPHPPKIMLHTHPPT